MSVTSCWMTQDGRYLWIGTNNGQLARADLETGSTTPWQSAANNDYLNVAASPNGRLRAYLQPDPTGRSCDVVIDDVLTGALQAQISGGESVLTLAMTPRDELVVGHENGAYVYALPRRTKHALHLPPAEVRFVHVLPDPQRLLVLLRLLPQLEPIAVEYDLQGDRVLMQMPVLFGRCQPVVSPEGEWLAVEDGKNIFLYHLPTRTQKAVFSGHSGRVDGLCFAGDGATLVSCSMDDGTVRFWDLRSRLAAGLIEVGYRPNTLEFTPDGEQLIVGGSLAGVGDAWGVIEVWSARGGKGRDSRLPEYFSEPYPGRYLLEHPQSGLVLVADVAHGSPRLAPAEASRPESQLWTLSPTPIGGFQLINSATGLGLASVAAASPSAWRLELRPVNDHDLEQRWIVPSGPVAPYARLNQLLNPASNSFALPRELDGSSSDVVLQPWTGVIDPGSGWNLRPVD